MSADSPNGISYYDDQLTTTIESGVYTLTFKVPKNTPRTTALAIGTYIETHTMHGKQLLLVITSIVENRIEKTIYCEDTTIQVLNSFVEGLETPLTPQRIDYYMNPTLKGTGLELRSNESTKELILELTSEQRILERLRLISEAFEVEMDFDVDFRPNSVPKRYISFLRKRTEDFTGFRVSSDKLIRDMERNVNTLNIATKLRVKGATLAQETITEDSTSIPEEPIVEEPVADSFVEKAIKRAYEVKALGRPYQWGGNGNPSWDCSGYMQECFKAAGKVIDHRWTTYTMWAQQGGHFKRINRSELKRGDLIMYDTGYTYPGDVNHVGLYVGPSLDAPNSVIHAGNPVGLTQRANSMTIIGFVRVMR